jgi:hypothetical protein
MPEELLQPHGAVVMDGAGNTQVRANCNAVVFDTISSASDVTLRNAVAKESSSTSFTIKVQGKIAAVVNSSSVSSLPQRKEPPAPVAKRPRIGAPYASMFAPPITKPLFLSAVLPPLIGRPKAIPEPQPMIPQPSLQHNLDTRPLSPLPDRPRLASPEIIASGMFPINDMLDLALIRSRPPSDTEIIAINALTELTGGMRA